MKPRKLRKQPVRCYCERDEQAEPGERLFKPMPELEGAYIIDLVESRGKDKRAAGVLTPQTVRKHARPRIAFMDDSGVWYWQD